MVIFQKLSWMKQMGIRILCDETAHPLEKKDKISQACSLSALDQQLQKSKSALSATATHPLSGVGKIPARVMCILEMPSATEYMTDFLEYNSFHHKNYFFH